MTLGGTAKRLVPVALIGGVLLAAQLLTGPRAHATCSDGQQEDSTTGMCWSQSGSGAGFYPSGADSCLPGRVGNCVGQLRSNPLENPGPQTNAGPLNPAIAGENAWLPSSRR